MVSDIAVGRAGKRHDACAKVTRSSPAVCRLTLATTQYCQVYVKIRIFLCKKFGSLMKSLGIFN